MTSCSRINHVEEARHQEVMAGLGVHDANWALCKVLKESDVKKGQNRLLLTKKLVCGGPIPTLFPELEELDEDGLKNAQRTVSVTLLDAEGRDKELSLCYLNSNKAYRVKGRAWKLFVQESGICKGDRLDLYACRRGDGERCLFSFTSKGGGASAWCNSGVRKRARQPAAAGSAAVLDHKRRRPAKSGRAERDNGQMGYVMLNDACTGGLRYQGDYYGSCKTREDNTPSSRSWKYDAAKSREKEAARGLLMLKYAIFDGYYY